MLTHEVQVFPAEKLLKQPAQFNIVIDQEDLHGTTVARAARVRNPFRSGAYKHLQHTAQLRARSRVLTDGGTQFKMSNRFTKWTVATAVVAGLAMAQTSPQPPQAPGQGNRQGMRQGKKGGQAHMLNRMAQHLNLTEAQKQRGKEIFEAARQDAQPVAQELRQARTALRDAVKAGRTEFEIEQLAAKQGELAGKLAAIHTKAAAKFYATLTPEQKQKADELRGMFQERMGPGRMAPGRMGPGRMAPGQTDQGQSARPRG
jgi:Spy/CpxP family protein refolding chaperone